MRVLVTGGTGFLGRAVVRAVAEAGHEAIVFARRASASGLPGQAFDGDIRDEGALFAASEGCEAVLHGAALVSTWKARSRDFDDVNVGGLQAVLRAARRRGMRRIVYTSSFMALASGGLAQPPRWNDYQRTKAAGDAIARREASRGAPLVCLYPGVVYGPGPATEGNLVGGLIGDHLRGRLPGVVGGDRIWSFAYLDDVAAAHVAALGAGRPGARYHLGGENAPPMRAFDIVRALTGRPLPRRIPDWLASPAALACELRASWFGCPPRLTTGTLEVLLHDWPLGHAQAADDLGYRVTPLDEGVARVVRALQDEGAGA
ncbi:MAG TPA: NAD-dependent epimerase/dehydratase family protein [Vicinamibacterales bacterium]|nr:NAD-dependent epimerase/dehydratase family protein [Vicinamibacterales bacterium]HPW20240.1 NAD-dependent epimerase/dehydratase family protein [Vicinamibacterales bacterium]